MNIIAKRIIAFSALVLWMGVIFFLSAQDAEDSQKTSGGIVQGVVDIVVEDFDSLPDEEKQNVFEKFSFSVRTFAHFAEFTVLGILSFLASLTLPLPERLREKRILWLLSFCLLFCFLYACSDEIHQLFSDGRSAQILDVTVDTSGAFLGMGFVALCEKRYRKKKEDCFKS